MAAADQIEKHLVKEHEAFLGFVRKRVGDPELAADILQESFLKAMKHAGELRDDESVVAWFYRILRRTIIDAYRRRDARSRALDAFEGESHEAMTPEDERTLCGCLRLLIPTLKPEYAEVIERVDLQQQPMETVAKDLNSSANNLRVRLHRGRKQLQQRLEQTCQVCAKHGCLDCQCQPSR
jgi:RNA polymerase sigma-70 factor (ECF subfamily)